MHQQMLGGKILPEVCHSVWGRTVLVGNINVRIVEHVSEDGGVAGCAVRGTNEC